MNNIKIILLTLSIALIGSCKKDKNDFSGQDNFVANFFLTKGGVKLQAAITPGKIVVTAPENFSLEGAQANIILSENATISPELSSIADWTKEIDLTITSHNGTKSIYKYSLQRKALIQDGDVVLLTQADVEELAALKLTQINGSLTIGASEGVDSITSLEQLSTITEILFDLTINSTYAGKDLAGLDNLEKIGGLKIDGNQNISTIELSKLISVISDLAINQSLVKTISFPELVNIDKGLLISNADSLVNIEFPKLKNIIQHLKIEGSWGTNQLAAIKFPALEKVGGDITFGQWKEVSVVELPELTTASALRAGSMIKMENISAPKLKSITTALQLEYNTLMSSMDFGELETIGTGLRIENNSLTNLDGLKSLKSTGAECFIQNMEYLTSIQGLKGLQSVGDMLYFASLPALNDDHLSGLANLASVKGDIVISQIPFKYFNGFALTQAKNLRILGQEINSIESIDVSNIDVTGNFIISNISTPYILKGKSTFNGHLVFENADPAVINGFNEVSNLSYTADQGTAPEKVLNIKKVTGSLSVNLYFLQSFKMPALEEVGGEFTLNVGPGSETLSFPLLKKTGNAFLDVAGVSSFALPALEIVEGDLNITIGGYDRDNLEDLQLPALTTINGTLALGGYSNYYPNSKLKNLNGLSSITSVQGVYIYYSTSLTDYTGLKNVLPSLTAANWKTEYNDYNPTYQDMVDGKYLKP